jgi:hypothetical protein
MTVIRRPNPQYHIIVIRLLWRRLSACCSFYSFYKKDAPADLTQPSPGWELAFGCQNVS